LLKCSSYTKKILDPLMSQYRSHITKLSSYCIVTI